MDAASTVTTNPAVATTMTTITTNIDANLADWRLRGADGELVS
jgi:hypothetical protein